MPWSCGSGSSGGGLSHQVTLGLDELQMPLEVGDGVVEDVDDRLRAALGVAALAVEGGVGEGAENADDLLAGQGDQRRGVLGGLLLVGEALDEAVLVPRLEDGVVLGGDAADAV